MLPDKKNITIEFIKYGKKSLNSNCQSVGEISENHLTVTGKQNAHAESHNTSVNNSFCSTGINQVRKSHQSKLLNRQSMPATLNRPSDMHLSPKKRAMLKRHNSKAQLNQSCITSEETKKKSPFQLYSIGSKMISNLSSQTKISEKNQSTRVSDGVPSSANRSKSLFNSPQCDASSHGHPTEIMNQRLQCYYQSLPTVDQQQIARREANCTIVLEQEKIN